MQVKEKKSKPAKPAGERKPKTPAAPALKVGPFVELMKLLDAQKDRLTNDQVRFVQSTIHRYENETAGVVKTKLAMPKPKKPKEPKRTEPPIPVELQPGSEEAHEFFDKLARMDNEDDAIRALTGLPDPEVERLARVQGLKFTTPQEARAKLAETLSTQRQIERIAGGGRHE